VPKNVYLDDMGREWRCERGFRKQGADCIEVRVPANAFIGYSGDDWTCEAGFRKEESACRAMAER
jgi:hypothetical protein